jgi:hypothetical protein
MVQAAGLPEPIETAPHIHSGIVGDRSMILQARAEAERTPPGPVPVLRLTAQKEPHPSAQRHTHRSGRPRGAPGKAPRSHKKFVTGQQAPG